MPGVGHPVAMGRFMMEEHREGPVPIAALEPVQGVVRDQVGDIARPAPALAHGDEIRIVIVPLVGQDAPMIEARGIALEMPFAEQRRLVAGFLQELGKRRLPAVEDRGVVDDAVAMAVLAGQQNRPAGPADRVRAEAVDESDAVPGQPVDMRRPVQAPVVAGERLEGVVVGHDEEDVGPSVPSPAGGRDPAAQARGQGGRSGPADELAAFQRHGPSRGVRRRPRGRRRWPPGTARFPTL